MNLSLKNKKPEITTDDRKKQAAAKSSVLAAFGLVAMKAVVGILTGSLGILAEALHSGLDLVAALVTWFAVRISSKPADREHLYGHGKYENVSALFETLLLLITCIWIIHAAVMRLTGKEVHIIVNAWSFLVMAISIIVDISRSRMLFKAAKKYNSQALEADALHFSTDIWSSAVVIFGLLCVAVSDWFPHLAFLRYADAVAAILVGIIVIGVSWKLGVRTVRVLLDSAPVGLEDQIIRVAEAVPGVLNCHHVRLRSSGAQIFVDMHVLMDGGKSLRDAHRLTEEIEKAIRGISPDADVTVHPEPK
ncbi:MAG: cation transporter [Candidatus Omnitrophica bacterium]|nr:cation transporter [Candidatus Omnitrophota bacterium]